MHLIEALASGVRGGENGTAALYVQGTASRATYYTDFDGRTAVSTGLNITLDAYGGVTAYVNQWVDVVVTSSLGVEVRRFTSGPAASATEYRGSAFTGTDRVTAAVAANNPVDVATVLDRALTSFGSTDWKVLIGATSSTVKSLLAQVTGIVYNVKDPQFGAVGDGATDDTAAIQAALSKSPVGLVVFPAGTYRITAQLTATAGSSLVGIGSVSSIIRRDVGGAVSGLSVPFVSATGGPVVISGLAFQDAQNNTTAWMTVAGNVVLDRCVFGNNSTFTRGPHITNTATTAVIRAIGCTFNGNTAVTNQNLIQATTDSSFSHYEGCQFLPAANHADGITADLLQVADANFVACHFGTVGSSGGAGTSRCIAFVNGGGTVTGCHFEDPTGTRNVNCVYLDSTMGASDVVIESGNRFGQGGAPTLVSPLAVSTANEWDNIQSLTRENAWIEVVDNTAAVTIEGGKWGSYFLHRTANGAQTLNFNLGPAGAHLTLLIWVEGAIGNQTLTWGTNVGVPAATPTLVVNANTVVICEFVCMKKSAGVFKWMLGAVSTNPIGAVP